MFCFFASTIIDNMKITEFFIWNAFLFCQGIERIWFNITNAFLIHTYINHKDEIYFSGVNSIFYFCFIFVFCFFLFFCIHSFFINGWERWWRLAQLIRKRGKIINLINFWRRFDMFTMSKTIIDFQNTSLNNFI